MRNRRLIMFVAALALAALPAAATLPVTAAMPSASAVEAPVADAAMRGDGDTVRSLLRDGADVNAPRGDGMTALHWAAMNDDAELISVLMYAGAVVEPTTRLGGYTPLHLASRDGRAEAVAALLAAGSRPETLTATGVSAIHLAAQSGSTDALRALLERGADVDGQDARAERTPLIFATAKGRTAAVETLLTAGADVGLATRVIDYRARAEADAVERRRRQRIIDAAKEPEEEEEVEEADAVPDEPDKPTEVPAAETPDAEDPDTETRGPETGESELPEEPDQPTTVPDGPDLDSPESDSADTDSADPDSADPANQDPDAPTTVPDAEPQPGAEEPEDPDKPEEPEPPSYNDLVGAQGGMTALHYAARDGRTDVAALLLEAGADVNQTTAGDGSTPLLVAIINGNFDLAMMMLGVGADPNLVSEDGVGPLFATINNEWALRTWYPQPTASKQQQISYLELMDTLLDAGADPDARVNTHVWYAAYNAGRMGVDFAGATPFWRAAYSLDVTAMRRLMAAGADPDIRTKKPAERRRRFDGAGPRGAQQTAEEKEEDKDKSGLPPIPVGGPAVHALHAATGVGYGTSRVGQQHRYVPDGWIPAARYLIEELGVDVDVRDHAGYSALHNAAARGDNTLVEYLVAQGADIMVVSRKGQTTVDMANSPHQRVQPYPETVGLLESLGGVNNDNCSACD